VVGSVFHFGGAVEGECCRHEDQDRPLAFEALFGDFNEFALVKGLGLERLDGGVDEGHGNSLGLKRLRERPAFGMDEIIGFDNRKWKLIV
jgi:hypothetical protein